MIERGWFVTPAVGLESAVMFEGRLVRDPTGFGRQPGMWWPGSEGVTVIDAGSAANLRTVAVKRNGKLLDELDRYRET